VRVLVTGARAQLGVELIDALGRSHNVIGLDMMRRYRGEAQQLAGVMTHIGFAGRRAR
jgi:nucleoside-diphosphate-sugar epimerase